MFVVVFDRYNVSNIINYDRELETHNQEADTLIILHAIDVSNRNPHNDLLTRH